MGEKRSVPRTIPGLGGQPQRTAHREGRADGRLPSGEGELALYINSQHGGV